MPYLKICGEYVKDADTGEYLNVDDSANCACCKKEDSYFYEECLDQEAPCPNAGLNGEQSYANPYECETQVEITDTVESSSCDGNGLDDDLYWEVLDSGGNTIDDGYMYGGNSGLSRGQRSTNNKTITVTVPGGGTLVISAWNADETACNIYVKASIVWRPTS